MRVEPAAERALIHLPPAAAGDRCILQSFAIPVEYPVFFTRNLFDPGKSVLLDAVFRGEARHPAKMAVYLDSGLHAADPGLPHRIMSFLSGFRQEIRLAGEIEVIPGGEPLKNDPGAVERTYRQLLERRLDRHSYVTAVGGGALLDVVGFAAATFHRGLRHIRVPTTVLAQNDAGIGVKNGRNALGVKNLVGSFVSPWAVIVDSAFLDTLPPREKRAGLAEAVKVALIRDRAFFLWIEANARRLAGFHPESLDALIRRCAALHLRQIAEGGDPFERGNARPLDFGHWAAHKLEILGGHRLRHGEAVAIGIALDSRYSVLAGLLPEGSDRRIRSLLERLGFSLWDQALELRDPEGRLLLLDGLREFREHLGGKLSVTLLAELGRGVEVGRIDPSLVERALDWLCPGAG